MIYSIIETIKIVKKNFLWFPEVLNGENNRNNPRHTNLNYN